MGCLTLQFSQLLLMKNQRIGLKHNMVVGKEILFSPLLSTLVVNFLVICYNRVWTGRVKGLLVSDGYVEVFADDTILFLPR